MPGLFTAQYQRFQAEWGVPVRTTLGRARFKLGYAPVEGFTLITPPGHAFRLPYDQFRKAYRAHLHRTTVARIWETTDRISQQFQGRPLVLLCFDDLTKAGAWCHRRLFAEWWLEQTGEVVEELGPGGTAATTDLEQWAQGDLLAPEETP